MVHFSITAVMAALAFVAVALAPSVEAARVTMSPVQPERRFPPSRYPLPAPSQEEWKIGSEAKALDAARQALRGLMPTPETDGAKAMVVAEASLLEIEQDRGPCVRQGKRLWRVTIDPVFLRSGAEEAITRRAVCYFDPIEGSLRRIEITRDDLAIEAPPEPSPREYQNQLMGMGPERWVLTRFPDSASVTLAKALETVDKEMGGVGSAKFIAVHLISWSYGPARRRANEEGGGVDIDFKDVWSIDLRGLPPFRASRDDIPVEARNHIRHIVDATTGQWVMASTVPQPDRKPPELPVSPDPAASPDSSPMPEDR